MTQRSSRFAAFVAIVGVGCGTQFSDPVLREHGSGSNAVGCLGGRALKLDGTGYGTMARLIQDDFTIEVWIKTNHSIMGQGSYVGNPVVFADVPAATVNDFGAMVLNNKFQMTVGNPDTAVKSTSDVTTNQWVHVAATRTRSTGIVLVFVNGMLEGAGTGNTHALADSTTMSFGGRAARDFFIGSMADLRIWRVVRSQSELAANMHHRLSGNESGLVGYYLLDDKTGAIALDASPSQNHAAMDGAIGWVTSDPPVCP